MNSMQIYLPRILSPEIYVCTIIAFQTYDEALAFSMIARTPQFNVSDINKCLTNKMFNCFVFQLLEINDLGSVYDAKR